jgi:hypothetical protein
MKLEDMKAKLEKIKLIFSQVEAPTPTVEPVAPIKMATDYPLADGTILTVMDMVVGSDVMAGDVAAADGSYTLADGTVLTVLGGKIDSITPMEAMPIVSEDMKAIQGVVAQMSEQIKALQTGLAAYKAQFAAQENKAAKQVEANKAVMELLMAFSEKPIAQPLVAPKKFEEMTRLEQLRFNRTKTK